MSDPGALDSALKVAEIIGIVGGLVGGLVGVGAGLYRIGRMSERVEAAIERQAENIAALQSDVRTLNEVVTKVALQGQRLDATDARTERLEKLVDDLRRGEGHILPLERALGAKHPRGGS